MTRQGVSRFLLAVLAALIGGLMLRSCLVFEEPEGLVAFTDDWDTDELRHAAFTLERPVTVEIDAVGSFESTEALAAYAWIIRREDGAIVWEMKPESVASGRGSLARAEASLPLEAGTYDVYFSTFGGGSFFDGDAESIAGRVIEMLRGGGREWAKQKAKWTLQIDAERASDAGYARTLTTKSELNAPLSDPTLLWAGGPAGRGEYLSYGFEIDRPTDIRIEATGEFLRGAADYGWIDDLSTGQRVWTMNEDDTEHAGGAQKNRRFEGTLTLRPGIYRAAYQTDRSHDVERWNAAPPTNPRDYGLFLFTDEPARVNAFDLWTQLPKIVEMTGIGDDAMEKATFTVEEPTRAWIYALGEMSDSNSRHDYGWLERDGAGRVWEMDYDRTRNAGGADRNRVEETYLELVPGTYTLHYRSDDSHSPERWRGKKPYNPDRWGVTLFALATDFEAVAVERASESASTPSSLPAPLASIDGLANLPVQLAPLRADQEVKRTFRLDRETRLRIVATGEIIRTSRYDYGWITDNRTDDIVWEMTSSNTEAAGGPRKNRRFEGIVTLPAGTYTVHFVTDDSHAYGDFSQGAPDKPEHWGITIERADARSTPPAPPAPPSQGAASGAVIDA